MVLWEITLGTAYFLGLKRTYRLALKIQRRLIRSKRPKIRKFIRGKTRAIFDVALKVHQNIQQRDIEVGRSLGNWILRWFDRMKPSAQIRVSPPSQPPEVAGLNTSMAKQVTGQRTTESFQRSNVRSVNRESDRHLFTSSINMRSKPFPALAMMMRPVRPAGTNFQYRHLWTGVHEVLRTNYGRNGFKGVIRKDIMEWMLRN